MKVKNNIELLGGIRQMWNINPVTRIHDKQSKRSKKKIRLEGKKICKMWGC